MILTDKEIRAKLVSRGAKELDDSELISVLIGENVNGMSAHEVATNILKSVNGSLGELSKQSISNLRMMEGIGIKRAAMINCAIELGSRIQYSEQNNIRVLDSNNDVLSIFRPLIGRLPYEELWVVYLTSTNTIIDKVKFSQGGTAELHVDPKLVVKRAIELLASSILMVHNHPSGDVSPSFEDITLTHKIINAAALFDICILDHLIISMDDDFSFSRAKKL